MQMENYSVHVDIHEAYRYMGGLNEPDNELERELISSAALIEKAATPRVVEKICAINKTNRLELTELGLKLEGKAISALLHDSASCILFCATIGGGVEALIRKWQLKNLSFTAMLDACASSAIESLCDSVQARLTEFYSAQGFFLTDRFSPGYGDLPIEIQPALCSALDTARRIGVSVSKSGIMIPRKSVTAIIGISENPQKHFDTGCRDCVRANNCNFRENGVTCYGQII